MGRAVVIASPFLIGLVWSCISPFLVRRLANRFVTELTRELAAAGYQETSPPALSQGAAADARPAPGNHGQPAQAPAVGREGDCGRAIPLPTRPENLRTYVEWLVDVPQLLPTILLGAAALIVAIAEARHVILIYIVCAVAALLGFIATCWIMKMNPQKYSGMFRFKMFTIGALIAIAINLVAAIIIVSVGA
jgi:hypothetical protein